MPCTLRWPHDSILGSNGGPALPGAAPPFWSMRSTLPPSDTGSCGFVPTAASPVPTQRYAVGTELQTATRVTPKLAERVDRRAGEDVRALRDRAIPGRECEARDAHVRSGGRRETDEDPTTRGEVRRELEAHHPGFRGDKQIRRLPEQHGLTARDDRQPVRTLRVDESIRGARIRRGPADVPGMVESVPHRAHRQRRCRHARREHDHEPCNHGKRSETHHRKLPGARRRHTASRIRFRRREQPRDPRARATGFGCRDRVWDPTRWSCCEATSSLMCSVVTGLPDEHAADPDGRARAP